MSNLLYALPALRWHKEQLEQRRSLRAMQQAANAGEDLEVLKTKAAEAAMRLKAVDFPDGEKHSFSRQSTRPCYDHGDAQMSDRSSQLSWNLGIIVLGADGWLYAFQTVPCPTKDCDVMTFGNHPITSDGLRHQREQGVADTEQEFLLSVLDSLGNP